MQNSHHQETPMSICFHTRIVEDFLGVHDFTPMILDDCTLFRNGELQVRVPHLKMLPKSIVERLLICVGVSFKEFEDYYNHLQAMKEFESLVDLSSNTLKK